MLVVQAVENYRRGPNVFSFSRADISARGVGLLGEGDVLVCEELSGALKWFFALLERGREHGDNERLCLDRLDTDLDKLLLPLSCIAAHPHEATVLTFLTWLDRRGEHAYEADEVTASQGGGTSCFTSLYALCSVGRTLLELEERDPDLVIVGPGLDAYMAKSYDKEVVSCEEMLGTLRETLDLLEMDSVRA
jgi:hypothetical protein